jgi:hypothetical protein
MEQYLLNAAYKASPNVQTIEIEAALSFEARKSVKMDWWVLFTGIFPSISTSKHDTILV